MPHQCFFNGDKLDGVLHFLYTSYPNDYFSLVTVSSTSHHGNFVPDNAIDFDESKYWHPEYPRDPGEYLQVDLVNHFVTLQAYSIQTSNLNPNEAHPKHWAFSASYNNESWTEPFEYVDEEGQMNSNLRSFFL